MAKHHRLIMGSALGLASIAVAIDHTRHRLPEPQTQQQMQDENMVIIEDSPCSLESSPCSLDSASPCSLDGGGSPCSL